MNSVVLCGSRRFENEILKFADDLSKLGVNVYQPYLYNGQEEWKNLSDDFKKFTALGLTHDHFYKIRMADVVFIFNKDGYVGNSTTLEIGYAMALGKPIYALEEDKEICRNVLFRSFIKDAKDLFKKL